jgi:hypothetical protein
MQQLEIEHKEPTKTTNNQKQVVGNSEELENKREGKGHNLAVSLKIFRLVNSDVYYVQSERSDNIYYYVKYNFDVFEYCSWLDNSTCGLKCKHQFAIEYAIRLGTLKDIEKLPIGVQRYPTVVTAKSYRDDDYDF